MKLRKPMKKKTKPKAVKKKVLKKKTSKAPKKAASKKSPQKKISKKKPVIKASPEKTDSDVKLSKNAWEKTLDFLEKTWPAAKSSSIGDAFESLRNALNGKGTEGVITKDAQPAAQKKDDGRGAWPLEATGVTNFDPLDLIKRLMMAQDMLFLSRQITYHISASSELPGLWGDRDRISQSFSRLIEHLIRRADRGSRIDIKLESFSLRNGPGVKISFESHDRLLDDVDSQSFLDSLLHGSKDEESGVSLYNCRQTILHQRGQMWADLPKPHHPLYNILLPASEEAAKQPYSEQQTFKYDIAITNYANVRKRFGIKKSASLVSQVEHYIRSLVRYPIDMVMSLSDKGVITTIYETQKGSANSVASRISQRLGREDFRIGKRSVDLTFRYNLSQLKPGNIELQEIEN
ncbi:MAG: hypothetical protein HN337_00745 [Deltaproteobacteria bacterium]|jgi:hypothetical protein|nr:hypothetical protein [Deltaproteobacteria bacterium]